MRRADFSDEISYLAKAIAGARLRSFAVPHLVVDNLLPDELVRRINANWPDADSFQPEVPGNYITRLYRGDYANITADRREFWKDFNETLWPALLASCAEAMAAPAFELFGDLYRKVLSLDGNWPLTLMQADATYPGHEPHTHFYHCPHWAFTVLIYIDPDDSLSTGTGIHRLKSLSGGPAHEEISSYQLTDIDRRVEAAMATFKWHSPEMPFERGEVNYRASRMFLMQDGPLAVHSVAFDHDFVPNPARARHAATRGRRRILRSHIKVHHDPFYKQHSEMLPAPLDPERFMRVMARDAVLSPEDLRYRDQIVRPFYRERLTAYARAAQCAGQATERAAAHAPQGLWNRLRGRRRRDEFMSQLTDRVP